MPQAATPQILEPISSAHTGINKFACLLMHHARPYAAKRSWYSRNFMISPSARVVVGRCCVFAGSRATPSLFADGRSRKASHSAQHVDRRHTVMNLQQPPAWRYTHPLCARLTNSTLHAIWRVAALAALKNGLHFRQLLPTYISVARTHMYTDMALHIRIVLAPCRACVRMSTPAFARAR